MSAARWSARTRVAVLAIAPAIAPTAHAQDRLVGLRALGAGAAVETVRFGGGLAQDLTGTGDTVRVRGAHQFTMPLTAAMPLGEAWTVDVTSVFAAGAISYDAANGTRHTASLSGLSDVRARATGRLAGDALIVTLGVNAPTGQTRLDGEQLTAVRVLAAPALGLGAPPVGAGTSGTFGVLAARRVRSWAVAGGMSYELHGSYAPIGALVAGASTTNFSPGDVIRVSLGADGLVGRHRLSLSVSGDAFGTDRLRGGPTAPTDPSNASGVASVRLGPELSADAQLYLAVPGVREAVLHASNRWRARFARDGITVDGSSGDYFDGGFRTVLPVTRHTDVLLGADARWQSGLSVDDALLTASAKAAGLTIAAAHRFGGVSLQPYARLQAGHVRAGARASSATTGASLGLTMLARF